MTQGARLVRAPRGNTLRCRGWVQEAALRMLMNNLDPDVAERPDDLIVYGGRGKAARSWEAFDTLVSCLTRLAGDETLLVQSGKAAGVLRTHPDAPRVLLANSLLVPAWATWETFDALEARGLTMFGQMTAGSWIYIGTQGILQGTFETFAAAARTHFGDEADLSGRWVLTAGLGGMGGAQPLAVTMNGGVCLAVEVDPARIARRLATRYVDEQARDLDDALRRCDEARRAGRPLGVALCANAAGVVPEIAARGIVPDLVTDQTSAHDPLHGYIPHGLDVAAATALRARDPREYLQRARASIAAHMRGLLALKRAGAHVFDYGNNLRGEAKRAGVEDAFDVVGFVPLYIRPRFCEGAGPFRWVALSGDPADIAATDRAVLDAIPHDRALHRWIEMASSRVQFQGLPARICWLKMGERARVGDVFNRLVKSSVLKAPIVIGRDHLDCGSVASPNRETEGMKDGSDAIADWPILNALVNAVNGASWVSVHHGGGVGMGNSIHAGMVIVADGTDAAAKRLERVLTSDPATGVIRHADAGYDAARRVAREHGIDIPGSDGAAGV